MLSIESNKDLVNLNTLAFSAIAEQFTAIENEAQLLQALQYAKENGLSYQVLSGGSNVLVSEKIPGLTLHMQSQGIDILEETSQHVSIRVAAGEDWHKLVEYTVKKDWQGLEKLALIPGLVGASPVQNIGAYGTELKDTLIKVRVYDTQLAAFIDFSNEQCKFEYRDSIFKRSKGRYIICAVDLKLSKIVNIEIEYQALQEYLDALDLQKISLKNVFEAICAIRSLKLPDPKVIANAGSFFKNPCVDKRYFEQLKQQHPAIIGFKVAEDEMKIAAAWMIDSCGWKGYVKQGVGVYPKQALVLTHSGGASINQLLELANDIKKSVYQKFQVHLEIEPQIFPPQN
ncbi:MAG: UDP-N-acetylmuramate dehydrogenase [Oceanospirillaceae bacterium]